MMDDLLRAWDSFPASSERPSLPYNYYMLQSMVQKKEMAPFCTIEDYHRSMEFVRKFEEITTLVRTDRDAAIRCYQDTEQAVEKELSGLLYLFTRQWGLSVSALYYYKEMNYRRAIAQTFEGIALSEYLVKAGVHTLLFRTAEVHRNLYKLFFKTGEWDKGAELAADVLTYLLNGESKGLYGSIFTERTYWDLLPYLREAYMYEYFKGLVIMLNEYKECGENEKVQLFQRILGGLEFEVNTQDRLIIYNWIYLKRCYISGDRSEFLQGFISFMKEEMSYVYDVLKISLFQDVRTMLWKSSPANKDEHLRLLQMHFEHKLRGK